MFFRPQSKSTVFITGVLAIFLCFSYVLLRCNILDDTGYSTFTLCGFHTAKIHAILGFNASEETHRNSSKEFEEPDRVKQKTDKPTVLCREPVKHLLFLKVHKTGSSTLLNIIYRYGLHNKLIFALPKNSNYFNHVSNKFNSSCIAPIPKEFHYDILCNHAIYNRTTFRPLFPNDTFYFSILRHPFMQFVSASRYYGLINNKKLQVAKPYQEFLLNRKNFTFPLGYNFYDNRMSYDLGLESKHFHDTRKIREFIEMLDKDFKLILISEYFDESLVLLRRHLCWTMKDIISFRMNVNHNHYNYSFSVEEFSLHRNQTTADYMIYEHYIKLFWKKIDREGPSFFSELSIFQKVQHLILDFCSHLDSRRLLMVSASQWNEAFQITRTDCSLLMKSELNFLDYIRLKQQKRLDTMKILRKAESNDSQNEQKPQHQ